MRTLEERKMELGDPTSVGPWLVQRSKGIQVAMYDQLIYQLPDPMSHVD